MGIEKVYADILKDHSNSERNKKHLNKPTTIQKGTNPSCGDEIELEIIQKDGRIEDAAFTGYGCAICQASTSIMIDLIKGKSITEVLKIVNTFHRMMKKEIKEEKELLILKDAVSLKEVSDMPARIKCASLGWITLENTLKNN
jgi:nitrogen fixation NifU-like protein